MADMELAIYLIINFMLVMSAMLAYKFWGLLGGLGGLLGAVFSYYVITSPNLIIQSVYDPNVQEWVRNTTPMGFFAYVPVILVFLNFGVAIKNKN